MITLDTSTKYDFHIVDALVGFFVALALTALYEWLFKKILYCKMTGNFYHGNKDENTVTIRHLYGENFSIIEIKDNKIQWKGSYERQSKGLLIGTFDYNYNEMSNIPDWGEHHLHLLPDNKTISVLIEPIVPENKKHTIKWHRKSNN